ncbi:anti-sigma-F factor Fin family protein [Bacillus sp. B190/17]|uniref:Anti-sigma-F factor Fin family protein n=1 Tax=Bacillus lumedeiriae TaxID=3058829 RepID=A0ABW8IBU4_9BACI
MAIHYVCRHCGTNVGSLKQTIVSSRQLGIDALTERERTEMVHYDSEGNITIMTICEDCEESLQRNPEFHQYDYFIH